MLLLLLLLVLLLLRLLLLMLLLMLLLLLVLLLLRQVEVAWRGGAAALVGGLACIRRIAVWRLQALAAL